jgi:hypothetical protein
VVAGVLRERVPGAGDIRAGGPAAMQGQDALPAPAITAADGTAAAEDAPVPAESFSDESEAADADALDADPAS